MRILYLGLGHLEQTFMRIKAGELPSDSLYGFELKQIGYEINFDSMKPNGILANALGFINKRYGFNFPDLKLLFRLRHYDIIVLNGPFSTLVTLACRFYNKKIVYLDTILRSPNNFLRKLIYKINIRFSSGTIMYSKTQLEQCVKCFKVKPDFFKLIPFAIDVPFCRRFNRVKTDSEPFILSVGRDQARDYKTLVEAMDGLGIKLKIVTLNYLLEGVRTDQPWIEVIEGVSYEELYQLYTDALLVVIPLKKWGTDYSSGTRGLLEAKVMGKGVIASYSLPLMEYLCQDDGVLYVEPENVIELRQKIIHLIRNEDDRVNFEIRGCEFVKKNYNMDAFAITFGNYLSSLVVDLSNGNPPDKSSV